jgi:thioredoxin-dependent peroxiredoxin
MMKIGDKAPNFELLNQDGKTVRLSDYLGKPVIMFSFPKANTAGCNMQACGFRDEFPEFASADAVILGISKDTPEELKAWKQLKKLPYDLLSDVDGEVVEAWGAWGKSLFGLATLPIINRSYWVIDGNGVLVDMQLGVGPKASVDKALEALKKIGAIA